MRGISLPERIGRFRLPTVCRKRDSDEVITGQWNKMHANIIKEDAKEMRSRVLHIVDIASKTVVVEKEKSTLHGKPD